MFDFKEKFPTPKESTKGVNTKKYIILHHTGTQENTIKGVLNGLVYRDDFASCHFVIDELGEAYKIGEPDDILWHCGVSKWGADSDLNKMSLGIEVIGPLSNNTFSNPSRTKTKELIQHLMNTYNIPMKNVIRHYDIAPTRKWDISDVFWNDEFKSFDEWKLAKLEDVIPASSFVVEKETKKEPVKVEVKNDTPKPPVMRINTEKRDKVREAVLKSLQG
jgi:N-acetyl-anhydromuramyl-L-alanine amidase AmpD